jgi:hypothetical protein
LRFIIRTATCFMRDRRLRRQMRWLPTAAIPTGSQLQRGIGCVIRIRAARTEALDGLIPPTTQATRPATNWHDGQITRSLSSPSRKNISVAASGKSDVQFPPSCPTRGALAIVANEGQGAVDVRSRLTSAAVPGVAFWRRRVLAYGEIVWVRRPGAGVKSAEAKAYVDDGGKKAGHQGEIV